MRDIEFAEAVAIADSLKIEVETLRTFAETFERAGVAKKAQKMSELEKDLNDLQQLAVEAAIEELNG